MKIPPNGPPEPPYLSPPFFEGIGHAAMLAVRRPELLGEEAGPWWSDVFMFGDWLIATFDLNEWFPPCWMKHGALREEVMALFHAFNDAYLGDGTQLRPTGFLVFVGQALGRCDTYWKVPCSVGDHREITAPFPSEFSEVSDLPSWWSSQEFDPLARW